MNDSQNIINLDDGWNQEIKYKALDPLEVICTGPRSPKL